MSEPSTTPGVGDAAVLGEHLAAVVSARAVALGPAIAERVATWEPQLEQRGIRPQDWEQWAPLVRAGVLCANPSNTDVAGHLAGDALSLTKFAAGRKMPMRMENIFRQGTGEAFLSTVTSSSRATVISRVRALVAGVTAAATQPTPTAAPTRDDQDSDPEGSVLEPLLLDREAPTSAELAAAGTARSTKGRRTLPAAICLGVGAGVAGESAANLKGSDVFSHHTDTGGPAVSVGARVVPLHVAFADPVLVAAKAAGPDGFVLGGRGGRNRYPELAVSLAKLDPHLVRMNAGRLTATWLAMHATRGVPLGDLLAAGGWTSPAPLDLVLPYLPPTTTTTGLALLTGTGEGTSAPAASAPAPLEDSA